MKSKAMPGFIFLLIVPSIVYAGDVYKCNVTGNSVYQGTPCEQGGKVITRGTSGSSQPVSRSSSLRTLFNQIQAANTAERQLQNDMDRDIARTKARLGSRVNDPSSNSEATRIRNEWLPKIQAAQRYSKALAEELRRRCPKGASLNSSTQTCNK